MLVMITSVPRVSKATALTSATRPGAHVTWHGEDRKETISLLDASATAALRLWLRWQQSQELVLCRCSS